MKNTRTTHVNNNKRLSVQNQNVHTVEFTPVEPDWENPQRRPFDWSAVIASAIVVAGIMISLAVVLR